MKLSNKEIKHIADLARLELTEAELKKYGRELSGILAWIDQLKEVDTTGIEPTAQVTGLENSLREDAVEDWDEAERKLALEQAPEMENGQYRVRRILE